MKIFTTADLQKTNNEAIPFPYIERVMVSGMGIFIFIDNFRSEDWYGYKGWYRRIGDHVRAKTAAENTHRRVLDELRTGHVVFDCGANEGFTSILYASKVGPHGQVVAFEPDPKNCELIKKNAEINGLRNIEIVQKALSDQLGRAQFASEVIQPDSSAGITVDCDLLDNYGHHQPDFIKIDVEGYELPVLRGARHILDMGPKLEIEMHLSKTTGINMRSRFGFDPDEIYKLLWRHNYDIRWPDGRPILLGDEPGGCIYCTKKKGV